MNKITAKFALVCNFIDENYKSVEIVANLDQNTGESLLYQKLLEKHMRKLSVPIKSQRIRLHQRFPPH